jgi:hypothetical protein
MKKTKFFALASLTTLAVVSVFGTKPTKKFVSVTTIYAATYATLFSGGSSTVLTTASPTGYGTCQFKAGTSGSAVTLKTSNGGTKVHFHN